MSCIQTLFSGFSSSKILFPLTIPKYVPKYESWRLYRFSGFSDDDDDEEEFSAVFTVGIFVDLMVLWPDKVALAIVEFLWRR